MRALIEKELRENLRWLPVGLLAIGLLLLCVTPTITAFSSSPETSLAVMMSLGGSIFACALGVIQSIFDLRSSARSYLWHRSVSSRAIFYSKLVVGALIYFLATAIPLTFEASRLAALGIEYLPVRPLESVPAAIAAMASYTFHPAAMLMMARRGRWFGTKLLPICSAIGVVFMATSIQSFDIELVRFGLIPILIVASLIITIKATEDAWCFALNDDDGYPKSKPGIPRLIVLTSGAAVAWGLGLLVLLLFASTTLDTYAVSDRHARYAIDAEGELWYAVFQQTSYRHGLAQEQKFVSGSKVVAGQSPRSDGVLPSDKQLRSVDAYSSFLLSHEYFPRIGGSNYQIRYFDRRGYVLNYDLTKRPAMQSIISRDGRRGPNEPLGKAFTRNPASKFAQTYARVGNDDLELGLEIWIDDDGIYRFDDREGTVESIVTIPIEEARFTMPTFDDPLNLFVVSNNEMHCFRVVDQNGKPLIDSRRIEGVVPPSSLELQEFAVVPVLPCSLKAMNMGITDKTKLTVQFDNPKPTLAKFDTMSNQEWDIVTFGEPIGVDSNNAMPAVIITFLIGTVPLVFTMITVCCFGALPDSKSLRTIEDLSYYLQNHPANVAFLLFVVVLAVFATIWIGRRRNFNVRQMISWCLAAVLLGGSAPIAVLAVYHRARTRACSRCEKPRRIDRMKCESCGADWEPPATEGIEVFDTHMSTKPASALVQ